MSASPASASAEFEVPAALAQRIDALVARYPEPRSAAVMVLHALQEEFGYLSLKAVAWAAQRLGCQPINLYELVTFYPMFRQAPVGKLHFRVCRTLSCALAGAHDLHRHLCEKLQLDPTAPGVQVSADGRFSVEFVECLADCHQAPVVMANDELIEAATTARLNHLMEEERAE